MAGCELWARGEDVYAVRLLDGRVVAARGPLAYDELLLDSGGLELDRELGRRLERDRDGFEYYEV